MPLIDSNTLIKCNLTQGAKVLVALSGGADSVALLLSLREHGSFELCAAHLNHGIRGEEAQRDCDFCVELCKSLSVPIVTQALDVPALAKKNGHTLEQEARLQRYSFLRQAMRDFGAECIATAHHSDDQAETVLMHLIRGTGLGGLAGMSCRSGDIIRPLLDLSKQDILLYLKGKNQPYCIDSTNLQTDATRNRIRLEVMPRLAELNPAIVSSLCSMAELVSVDEDYLQQLSVLAEERCKLNRHELSRLAWPLLMRILKRRLLAIQDTVERSELEGLKQLLSAPSGTAISWRNGMTAWVDSTSLHIEKVAEAEYCFCHAVGQSTHTPRGIVASQMVLKALIPCKGNEAYLDFDRLIGGLTIRSRQRADRFTPLNMQGSKLLSDYLTDKKVPRFKRDIPLVCDEKGIIYIAGHGICDRVKITKTTVNILHLIFTEV